MAKDTVTSRRFGPYMVAAVVLSVVGPCHAQPIAGEWTSLVGLSPWSADPKPRAGVYETLWFDPDGDGPINESLYIGGYFRKAAGQESHNLARWDGSKWWHVGNGVSGPVHALV
jgi:hypothetical protein